MNDSAKKRKRKRGKESEKEIVQEIKQGSTSDIVLLASKSSEYRQDTRLMPNEPLLGGDTDFH